MKPTWKLAFLSCFLLLSSLSVSTPNRAAAQTGPHYPLRLSSDGHHIIDATGTPVFFNAASPWHILARLTRDETMQYLDERQAQGFNALLVALIVSDGYRTGSSDNAYGDPPFENPGDFSTPNEAYFAHADWMLQQANARGMTVFLFPAFLGYACGSEGWCQEMQQSGTSVMRDYGRWLGNRYRDQPNIVWVEGGDVDAAAYGAMDLVDAVAEGIAETDPNHLQTAECVRYDSAVDCYDRPWLDLNTTYAQCTEAPSELRNDAMRSSPRPTVYIEGRYEYDNNATTTCIRSQAYWSLLEGAAGHFYGGGGSEPLWDFFSSWQDAMDSPGAVSMFHFGKLLQSRRWDLLVPDVDHTVLTAGYGDVGGPDFAAAAATSDGQTILAYLPSARPVTVALSKVSGSTAEAWWFNPATGDGLFIGNFATNGSHVFSPASGSDWVLVIDNAAANLPDVWNQPTAAAPPPGHSLAVSLDRPIPNPFNPRTEISFRAPSGSRTTVQAFDARGRRVGVLFSGTATGAQQHVNWDADGLPSGTYFILVRSEGSSATQKVAIVR